MDFNKFFKRISRSPLLMWKFLMPFLFITLGGVFYFIPSYGFQGNKSMNNTFALLLALYGLFRSYTFYTEYKRIDDEQSR